MPVWFFGLAGTIGKVAWTAVLATARAFLTERRIREYMVYTARYIAEKYPQSQWPKQIAQDLEKDWEAEYKEDI